MGKSPKGSITITDIANQVGVSTATVSRVFNGSDLVRPELAERILALSEEIGFTPRQAARRDTLVLVIEEDAEATYTSYVATMLKELVHVCADRHLRLDIVTADETRLVRGRYIMGAIALLWNKSSLRSFAAIKGAPLVAISADTDVFVVGADERHGVQLALDHLYKAGHRSIGLISRGFDNYGDQQRVVEFKDLVAHSHGGRVQGHVIIFNGSANDLLVQLAKLFKQGRASIKNASAELPTALIATSEDTGIQLMYCLDLLDLRVPEDISVISYEAAKQSEFLIPPHTTVGQDYRNIVRLAVESLTAEKPMKGRKSVPFRLIERESVARISR